MFPLSANKRAVGSYMGLVSGRGVVCRMPWGMDGGLVGGEDDLVKNKWMRGWTDGNVDGVLSQHLLA